MGSSLVGKVCPRTTYRDLLPLDFIIKDTFIQNNTKRSFNLAQKNLGEIMDGCTSYFWEDASDQFKPLASETQGTPRCLHGHWLEMYCPALHYG